MLRRTSRLIINMAERNSSVSFVILMMRAVLLSVLDIKAIIDAVTTRLRLLAIRTSIRLKPRERVIEKYPLPFTGFSSLGGLHQDAQAHVLKPGILWLSDGRHSVILPVLITLRFIWN